MRAAGRPLFSILIPSYNRPQHIVQCIESVFANQEEEIEIIVSDDASPQRDAIVNAIRPYLSRSNVHFYQQSTNIGEPANRNFLVSQATGRHNIILCDDDQLLPHAFQTIRMYIERKPDYDLYMFGYRVIDALGQKCYDRVAPKPFEIGLNQPGIVRRMFEATWLPFLVCHPATFCCRYGVEKEIQYRQDVCTADDFMFLLECLNKSRRMYVIPECLMTYRRVAAATMTDVQSNQSSDNLTVMKAYTKVYYALQCQRDLDSSLADFVYKDKYRERFLYDLLILRIPSLLSSIALLGLRPAHREELTLYAANRSRLLVLFRMATDVVRDLSQVFGLRGLLYSIQVGFAFIRHRVLA